MKHVTALLALAMMLPSAPIVQAQTVFINEIHYDNAGNPDTDEGIEIAGPSGTNLSTYSIVLYNGANGDPYETLALTGTIPNQQNGYGTLSFAISPIQNGAPDGVALLQGATVVQFLSYEGSFTADSGPANGSTSVDITVSEGGSDAAGLSLQLTGNGTTYGDFTWTGPVASTAGAVNTNQTFVAPAITNAPIRVMVDSLVANCDGSYTAFFGYLSDNTETITIATGPNNRFSPGPADRGQTTDFLPGRQRKVFSVDFDGSNLVWSLKGPNGQTRTTTAGLAFPNITQATGCPTACDVLAAPDYLGGYVTNSAGTRAFIEALAPAGGTEFVFYNTNNLIVGNPEQDTESGTPLLGATRTGAPDGTAGNVTFAFAAGSEPTMAYFPIANAGAGAGVRFFLDITDTCDRTVRVDPAFSLAAGTEARSGFALAPAQPNPVSTSAVIGFSLETASHVRLVVFDVLGREVARLVDEVRGEGVQSVRLEASALPSGVYVYRLEAGGQALTRTVTVAR